MQVEVTAFGRRFRMSWERLSPEQQPQPPTPTGANYPMRISAPIGFQDGRRRRPKVT